MKHLRSSISMLGLIVFVAGTAGLTLVSHTAYAQTVSLKFKLEDPNGTAISNAYVYVYTSNYSTYNSAYTDSAGVVKFLDLPTGSYTMNIYSYNTQGYSDPPSQTVSITYGSTTDLGTIKLLAPNASGYVYEPDGTTPATNVYVSVHTSDWATSRYAYTDSNGKYQIYLPAANTYEVDIWSSYTGKNGTTYSPPTKTTFTYSGSGNVTMPTIKFLGNNLIGKVFQPDSKTVPSGAWVYVNKSDWSWSTSASVKSDGSFGFGIPSTGTYTVKVNAYNSTYPDPDPITVTMSDISKTTDLGNILLKSGNLFIKVTEPDGTTAVSGASVSIYDANWSNYKYGTTASNGTLILYLTTQTTYTVSVYANSTKYSDPSQFSFSFTGSTVYYDGTTGSSPIKLEAPSMKFKIFQPDGKTAAQYASISVYSSGYINSAWSSTDSNGEAITRSLPTGSYTVQISPPYTSSGTVLVAPAPFSVSLTKGTTDLTYYTSPIVLSQPTKTIKGAVKYPGGGAVTDASVSTWSMSGSGGSYASTTTDSGGNYTLIVGPGKYQLSIWPTWTANSKPNWGYYKQNPTAEFTGGTSVVETQQVDFTVDQFTATLSGTIVDPNGTAFPTSDYVSVSAYTQNGMGGGNWSQADSQGKFSMMLPAGSYNVSIYASNSLYSAPDIAAVTLADNQNLDLGTLKFLKKTEKIEGTVSDSKGNPLSGQSVYAWKKSSSSYGWANGTTDSQGKYSLAVTVGRWEVSAYPSWSSTSSNNYVTIQEPQEIVLTANETKSNINFQFGVADATIKVTMADESGTAVSSYYGWASAQDPNSSSSHYGNMGGTISAGSGEIKVPAGTWDVGVSGGWGGDYTAASKTKVTIASGETKTATVTLAKNDAKIKGKFVDKNGNAVKGLNYASIFSEGGGGGYAWGSLDTANGTYELKVAKGTWKVGYWVDSRSGYLDTPIDKSEVTVTAGGEATLDFTLLKADAKIEGIVQDPDGNALASAKIIIRTEFAGNTTTEDDDFEDFRHTKISDKDGKFSIDVPEGKYYVGVTMPPDLGYINPETQIVTVAASRPTEVTMKFTRPDSKITGIIKLNGTASEAEVWAWTNDGGLAQTYTTDGTYTLNVDGGENWVVGATYEQGGKYYLTEETAVNVPEEKTVSQDLSLEQKGTLPESKTMTFTADKDATLALDNGVTITMPAFSIDNSKESVAVTATPTVQLIHTSTEEPLSLGYNITATYTSGQKAGEEITALNSDIAVKIPYTDQETQNQGVTEADIQPSFWDETSGTWEEPTNVVLDPTNNTVTCTTKHLTSFAVVTDKVTGKAVQSGLTTTLTSPKDQSIVTTTSVVVSGNVSDPSATVTVELNNQDVGTIPVDSKGDFSVTASGLVKGANTITVDAIKGTAMAPTVSIIVNYEESNGEELTPIDAVTNQISYLLLTTDEGSPRVRVVQKNGKQVSSFDAFSPSLLGKFRAVAVDVDHDGDQEIAAYNVEGYTSEIRIFTMKGKLVTKFYSHDQAYRGGIDLLLGDVNHDGASDLIVSPKKGGSNIRAFAYNKAKKNLKLIDWFFGFDGKKEASMKLGDVTGDGKIDLVLASKDGAEVRVFTYNSKKKDFERIGSFGAYTDPEVKGLKLFTGDIDGDGTREIVTWPESKSKSIVKIFQYQKSKKNFKLFDEVDVYGKTFRGMLHLHLGDLDQDGKSEMIVVPESGGGTDVRVYTYNAKKKDVKLLGSFMAYDKSYRGGASIEIANVDGDKMREVVVIPMQGSSIRVYELNAKKKMKIVDGFDAYKKFSGEIGLKATDFDGDGTSELVTAPKAGSALQVKIWELNTKKDFALTKGFWGFDAKSKAGAVVRTILK